MKPNIDTITIGVTDISGSREFYEHGFGFAPKQSAGDCAALAMSDAATLELCEWDTLARETATSPDSSGFRGFTLSYIVEQATDVDDMLARLIDAGGSLVKAPRFAVWGYSGHVADPSGHLWKIASPKRRPVLGGKREGDKSAPPAPAQELALTIGVADMKRAKQFYKDGLGNETKKDYSKFVSFDGEGNPDLAMYKWDALADDADVPSTGSGFRGFAMSHIVDSTEAVDQLLDRATRAGARVLKRPSDSRRGGGSAYFADVDGYLWKIAARV